MKIKLFIGIILIMLTSCEKAFDWTYSDEELSIPVIESIITNENIQQKVILSWTRSNPNALPQPITDALVSVSFNNNTYNFAHDTSNPGTYMSVQPFIGVIDVAINIEVNVNGISYTGTDMMIPVSSTQKANFKLVNTTDSLYEIVSPGSTFYSSEQAMWVIDIDWSGLPAYMDKPADSCRARLFYYDLKTLDVSQVFAPDRQNILFPKGASVHQVKYSLSPGHAEFRRSLLLETEWRGGLFDVTPGTVFSNIKGGAVGFFGACSVTKFNYTVQ